MDSANEEYEDSLLISEEDGADAALENPMQELHMVCDTAVPGEEPPSTQLELEEDSVMSIEPDGDLIGVEGDEMRAVALEDAEAGLRHVEVETTVSTQEYTSTDVLVYGMVTWIFYGPAAAVTWGSLGVQLILISMVMAGVAIAPVFLVSPLLAFPVVFLVVGLYRKFRSHQRIGKLQVATALVTTMVLWLNAVLIYVWARGEMPVWEVILIDGIIVVLVSPVQFFLMVKDRQRTRTFVRVNTENTHETVYCKDAYMEDAAEEIYHGYENEEEEDEDYDQIVVKSSSLSDSDLFASASSSVEEHTPGGGARASPKPKDMRAW